MREHLILTAFLVAAVACMLGGEWLVDKWLP